MLKKLSQCTSSLSDLANSCATFLCWLMTASLFVLILIQVVLRYVFHTSLNWGSDVVWICFSWAVLISFSIALKRKAHIEFHFLVDMLPPKMRQVFSLISAILCLCFFVYVTVEGFNQFQASSNATFIVLDMSKKWQVLPLPLSGIFMFLHSLAAMVQKIDELASE